jgi:hypothetical protein
VLPDRSGASFSIVVILDLMLSGIDKSKIIEREPGAR